MEICLALTLALYIALASMVPRKNVNLGTLPDVFYGSNRDDANIEELDTTR